jgi:hypothetical protein
MEDLINVKTIWSNVQCPMSKVETYFELCTLNFKLQDAEVSHV